jgi:anaerobic selenocysteine-containing dehydrogenase
VNLALLRGMVGRPGAGLLPIRGHSNVQGVGSMGVAPKLSPKVFDAMESYFNVRLPTSPGLDTLACLDAMYEGRLRTGWCLGGNLFGASPDANRARDALGRLESVVYFHTTLNTGHAHGRAKETLILPVRARDEEPQATTQESMFNYVRLSEGGPARHEGPRSEAAIVAEVAARVLGAASPVDWAQLADHGKVREAIAATIPGYEPVGQIGETRGEFQIAGRTFHVPRFATASGKARFHVVSIPDNRPTNCDPPVGLPHRSRSSPLGKGGGDGPVPALADSRSSGRRGIAPLLHKEGVAGGSLRLMTIRSEGQFNTVVYEEEDIYRHQERRDVILMNAEDIERLGLRVDQRVAVQSGTGEMRGILVRAIDIRAGNAAMYYPEANVLVPPVADAESRTPAFKSVGVSITPDHSPACHVQISITPKEHAASRKLNAC